jgi:hypothetical protein
MPKGNNIGSNYSSSLEASKPVREVEISREISRADSISRETGSALELLEKRLSSVLRQEPVGGYLGLTVGWVEGIELNFFGAVLGIDVRRPALKFPGVGRLGLPVT